MDVYAPGSGAIIHDFLGDFPGTPLFWTLRLPDDSVTIEKKGRRLTVDVTDIPVTDVMRVAGTSQPGTVSFHVTWNAHGAARRLGRPKAADGDPAAFTARIRTTTRATGVFSGTAGAFSFLSTSAKSVFAELGTERNGRLRSPAAMARCLACAPPGASGDPRQAW